MSSFTEPLLLEDIPGTNLWRVGRNLPYHVGGYPSKEVHVVPQGFVTDLASIPRVLWTPVGHPAGPYRAAAVLHDYLYVMQCTTRRKADGIFLEAMKVLGVSWYKRWTLYTGVRTGGWVAWHRHTRRTEAA